MVLMSGMKTVAVDSVVVVGRRTLHPSNEEASERAKGTPMLNFFAEEKSWSFCGVGSVIDDVCL